MSTTTNSPESAVEFLKAAYSHLEFDQGALLSATTQPESGKLTDWLDRGDWQSLASQVGAETIFFVDRDPVVVFARVENEDPQVLLNLYQRIWCMSRPQLLFLASPGQLAVYDLTKAPPKPDEALGSCDRLIGVARSIREVQSRLAAYHRERVETGAVFGEERFRDSLNRADRALIRDLKTVRHKLATLAVPSGRKPQLHHLHSLIGRAIFVRYLEDRDVLVPGYFEKVAAKRQTWQKLLAQVPSAPAIEQRMAQLRFLRVLQDKEFTYALFNELADDFNGDTFPIEEGERDCIHQEHLDVLRGFLMGVTSPQQELFFFAYRFNVIPIELISAIYEEFYNERTGRDRNQGSHYTPPALVEFVLANTLTPEVLSAKPRVLDPACGSGIFLVESFRRMVRHLWEQNGKRVSRPQLRKILREQIAGIDINEEAVRVAAFSLYLAFLHYQEPREINSDRRLPYLKWVPEAVRKRRLRTTPDAEFFDVLIHANAFEIITGAEPEISQRFGQGSANVVVGNPPWGYPKKEDTEGQKALKATLKWCNANSGRPVGDKELSQSFIHLTLALLQDGGNAGLLVSSGVLFKHHANSRSFRKLWLESVRLKQVVNFAHVRQIFFSGRQREAQGISPFVSVVFEKTAYEPGRDTKFEYWSAKRTAVIENTKCVVLNRGDMHWLSQRDCLADERLWKIYWWGGHRDEATIRSIDRFTTLSGIPSVVAGATVSSGQGFKIANKSLPAGWLKNYRELPSEALERYGPFNRRVLLTIPSRVERRGVEEVYHGHRLLVGRGIKSGGVITARFETKKYAFKNSIHGVRLDGLEPWQEATIIAIFWSSLARYFYFTTSGSWGFWHDEIHLEDVERMPICFPTDPRLRDRITGIVSELQKSSPPPLNMSLFHNAAVDDLARLEGELDEAVFDLYGLTVAERDLIRDSCTTGLDLFYEHNKGTALQEVIQPAQRYGTLADLPHAEDGLSAYLRTFLETWNTELAPDGEFSWRVLSPASRAPLLAVCFTTRYKNGDKNDSEPPSDAEAWRSLLTDLDQDSLLQARARRIFVDTFFRHIGDREILFIKRNERRFWTRSFAREDAESALTHVMNLEEGAPEATNE
jgi:type I restriction-modification system DNA methylase subunit